MSVGDTSAFLPRLSHDIRAARCCSALLFETAVWTSAAEALEGFRTGQLCVHLDETADKRTSPTITCSRKKLREPSWPRTGCNDPPSGEDGRDGATSKMQQNRYMQAKRRFWHSSLAVLKDMRHTKCQRHLPVADLEIPCRAKRAVHSHPVPAPETEFVSRRLLDQAFMFR